MNPSLIEILHEGGHSCVIWNRGVTRTFEKRGVADLFYLYNNEADFLRGASVADKVVGKAAAALMILGGVGELYTDVISSLALDLLNRSGIKTTFGEEVPHIINRSQTDWCPLEKLCLDAVTAEEALPKINEFINKMKRDAEKN